MSYPPILSHFNTSAAPYDYTTGTDELVYVIFCAVTTYLDTPSYVWEPGQTGSFTVDIDIHYPPWSILYPHLCTVVYSDANIQVILLLYNSDANR